MRSLKFSPPAGLLMLAILLPGGCGKPAPEAGDTTVATPQDPQVGAVQGPSWLEHLGASADETRMGEMGGSDPAPPSRVRHEPDLSDTAVESQSDLERALREPFELTGADLYRINCQACHGVNGQGHPPEILSVLPAVTALAVLPKDQAAEGFLTFLTKPGTKMPPFDDVDADEAKTLLGHLERLLTNGSPTVTSESIRTSAARVGEQVIKGTCHICHSAVGPSGGDMSMVRGTVPPLARFSTGYPLERLDHVVRNGAAGGMGMMGTGERMPPLPFLTDEEVTAAYLYLVAFPPQSKDRASDAQGE